MFFLLTVPREKSRGGKNNAGMTFMEEKVKNHQKNKDTMTSKMVNQDTRSKTVEIFYCKKCHNHFNIATSPN